MRHALHAPGTCRVGLDEMLDAPEGVEEEVRLDLSLHRGQTRLRHLTAQGLGLGGLHRLGRHGLRPLLSLVGDLQRDRHEDDQQGQVREMVAQGLDGGFLGVLLIVFVVGFGVGHLDLDQPRRDLRVSQFGLDFLEGVLNFLQCLPRLRRLRLRRVPNLNVQQRVAHADPYLVRPLRGRDFLAGRGWRRRSRGL